MKINQLHLNYSLIGLFLLLRYFKRYGDVGDIYIPRDRTTLESRGFAFVRFYEERDAEDAMDAMDGKVCLIL